MNTTATTAQYLVDVVYNEEILRPVGRYRVEATSREEAERRAIQLTVITAKEFNAKNFDSLNAANVSWMLRDEDASAYKVFKIRKAPKRK